MSLPSPRILLIGGYLGNKRWTSSILTLDLASLLPSLTALRPALATTATATTSAPPRAPPPPLPPPPLGATLSAISAKAKAGAGGGLHTAGPARRKRSHASDSEAEGDPQSAAVGAGRHEAEVAGGKATPGGKAAAGAKPTKPGAAVGAQGGKRARAQGRAVAAAAAAEEAEEAAAEEEEEEEDDEEEEASRPSAMPATRYIRAVKPCARGSYNVSHAATLSNPSRNPISSRTLRRRSLPKRSSSSLTLTTHRCGAASPCSWRH